MQQLTVFLKIPFDSESPTDSYKAIAFTHWFPLGRDNGIIVEEGSMRLLLWFDEKCNWWASQPSADELKKYVNIDIRYAYVEVQVSDVRQNLLQYMQTRDFSKMPPKEDEHIGLEYSRLAREVLTASINRVNRLIAIARSSKGQYWLSEYKIDFDRLRNYFTVFEGRGQIDRGEIFRFEPPQADVVCVTSEGVERYITESDWPKFREFVMGGSKPQLVGELLAGSERLLSIGHYRSAITEAVTALEVAVNRFAENPNVDRTFAPHLAGRLALSSLKSQVEKLGLSASMNYLLPTILSEELLPASVIAECQSAITRRQNIVHNGQRSVSEDDARRAVCGIRVCCDLLEKVTEAFLEESA
jgi:hypothetical protein